MHAEDATAHHSSNWEEIKRIGYSFPQPYSKFAFAFIVKAINFVELAALMITPQQEEVERVFDLVGHQQTEALQGLFAPVHVVPQKEVAALARLPRLLEDVEEVFKLTVDVAADDYGRIELQQHGLAYQQRFEEVTQTVNLLLSQRKTVPHPAFCSSQSQDYLVYIKVPLHSSRQYNNFGRCYAFPFHSSPKNQFHIN